MIFFFHQFNSVVEAPSIIIIVKSSRYVKQFEKTLARSTMNLSSAAAPSMQSAKHVAFKKTLNLTPLTLTRGKRTKSKGTLPPVVQRAVTQLSVLSASRKQPKLLKLSREDFIKHETIQHCWSTYQKEIREKRNEQLKLQYQSIKNAMDTLEQLNPKIFEAANAPQDGKRFPMELKVPTEFPPNKLWNYTFKKE